MTVTAPHPSGTNGRLVSLDGQTPVALTGPGPWRGLLRVADPTVPAGGRIAALKVEARRGDGSTDVASFTRRLVDFSAPIVTGFTPSDGEKIPGSAVGAAVEVTAFVRDSPDGYLRSGVTAVTVEMDGVATAARLVKPGDPSTWAASVFVPAADDHVISVTAVASPGRQNV